MFLYFHAKTLAVPSSCQSDWYLSAAGAKIGGILVMEWIEFIWTKFKSAEGSCKCHWSCSHVFLLWYLFWCSSDPWQHDDLGVQKEYTHSGPNSSMSAAMRRYEDVCPIVVLMHRWHWYLWHKTRIDTALCISCDFIAFRRMILQSLLM